jgi:hypothetical protein
MSDGLFVEYYDADPNDPLFSRTGEMDYAYQAEQWAIDALEIPDVVRIKAFHGPRPPIDQKQHDRVLFAEWRVIETAKGRDLERLL